MVTEGWRPILLRHCSNSQDGITHQRPAVCSTDHQSFGRARTVTAGIRRRSRFVGIEGMT